MCIFLCMRRAALLSEGNSKHTAAPCAGLKIRRLFLRSNSPLLRLLFSHTGPVVNMVYSLSTFFLHHHHFHITLMFTLCMFLDFITTICCLLFQISLGLLHAPATHILWPPGCWQKLQPALPPECQPLLNKEEWPLSTCWEIKLSNLGSTRRKELRAQVSR